MNEHMRIPALTVAAALCAAFLLCGCQMKGSERPGSAATPAREQYDRGIGFYNKGLWNEAVMSFNQAVKADPGNAMFYAARGNTYIKMGNIPFAIVDLTKAVELSPKTAEFYNSRSKAYLAVNEYENALSDANKAEGLGLNTAALKKKIMQAGKIFDADEFVLTGIMVDKTQGYLAIINNEIVGVGSMVNRARVAEITQYHVRLDRNGTVITRTLPSSDVSRQPASTTQ